MTTLITRSAHLQGVTIDRPVDGIGSTLRRATGVPMSFSLSEPDQDFNPAHPGHPDSAHTDVMPPCLSGGPATHGTTH